MRVPILLVLLGGLFSGCLLNNINPSQQLAERVQEYSDATRWNRLDLAVHMVAAGYMDTFTKTHAQWGRGIEVADAEVMHIQLAPDGNTATSTLAYSWYDLSAMTLARTVVRQTWDIRNGYRVTDETVIDGATELLPVPEPSEAEPSHGELASAP